MPLGGLAKAAELNGLPGPKHVLELKDQLKLSAEQSSQVSKIFEKMQSRAKTLGQQLISVEAEMDQKFKEGKIDPAELKKLVDASAKKLSELRYTHLVAHLKTKKVLTEKQVHAYNGARGYTSNDPCTNIPKGHPPEMWKRHNNCE